ncbi:Hint domain-containing protein [Archangium sp.]|uniref:Hint domain-containing protein n=1 Tax=Archangium sp. TaxID=1872627 RepID=UPI00286D5FBA|nr:Hint domain-containing protein [Archangium sp.]
MRTPLKRAPRCASSLLSLALLATLAVGCGQQRQPPPLDAVDKQVLAEDSRAMAGRYAQWRKMLHAQRGPSTANEQMPLDLNDPVQYRFVMNRLKASGLSALNAPRLFARLADLKTRLPLPVRPMGEPETVTAQQTPPEQAWCGHMIPLGTSGSDASTLRFEGTSLSSCFGGSDYGFVDFNAYATNSDQTVFDLLASETQEEYAAKVLETAPVNLALARSRDQELFVDSVAMAFNERTGKDHLTYTSVVSTLHAEQGDGDLVLEHPRDLLDNDTHDDAIRMCLERGSIHGFLDCDYGSVRKNADGTFTPFVGTGATGIAAVDVAASRATTRNGGTPTWIADKNAYWEPAVGAYDQARFQIPTRGVFKPHVLEECTVTQVESKVVAILQDSGGWCDEGYTRDTMVGKGHLPWTTPTVPGEYPFNGILDFGKGNCLDNSQNVRVEMWVYASGTCPDPFGGAPEPFRCPSKTVVKPVDYTRVCMAEGTQVTTAEGKKVAVEQVKVGDKLLSDGKGVALTVTTVSRGGETKPLVKLRDDKGHEVQVTETHPMVSARRGLVQAGELKVGEAVMTSAGATKLVAVERVPYQGMVYNFALGTPEELAKAGPEARTMFANGFLVGDSKSQAALEKERRVDARAVLAKLHGAWHQDFRLSQERRKTARR